MDGKMVKVMSNYACIVLAVLLVNAQSVAQSTETLQVQRSVSQSKATVYLRRVRLVLEERLYQVQDFFENGQMQMDGTYSSLNKHIKEDYQCNYRENTKEGECAYLPYTPTNYEAFPEKHWPLVIYLHGGSERGTNLTKLSASGLPDQIYDSLVGLSWQ